MYKVKETESALKITSKTAMGFIWTVLFFTVLIMSFYMSFEYVSIKCDRNVSNKVKGKLLPQSRCYITHFDFKNNLTIDSLLLSDIIRMDKGYFSSLEDESDMTLHYNPTFITSQKKHYPLRKVSSVAFTPELLSKSFNDFIVNKHPSLNIWDWYMGYWGVVAGLSFLALLFLAVSGRYQVAVFDKINHTFFIKSYGFSGIEVKTGNWKDIKRIIYQDKATLHKKGIFFVMKVRKNPDSKKYKTEKVYFTHYTDKTSKRVAQRIANLVRPIAKPESQQAEIDVQK